MGFLDAFRLPDAPQGETLDSAATYEIHRHIILSKPFFKSLYIDFYRRIEAHLPKDRSLKRVIEIGSGAGFIKEVMLQVETSDVMPAAGVDHVFFAERIPFEDNSVDAFLMLNVFHHLSKAEESIKEMQRCLRPGGRIIMIEPANTPWERFIMKHAGYEPFEPEAGWQLSEGGRLSSANGALPWIVFVRDRERLQKECPRLEIKSIQLHTPFGYLISGGLTYKAFLPSWGYPISKAIEFMVSPFNRYLAMFMTIVLEKK